MGLNENLSMQNANSLQMNELVNDSLKMDWSSSFQDRNQQAFLGCPNAIPFPLEGFYYQNEGIQQNRGTASNYTDK